jgi:hypothetical protein
LKSKKKLELEIKSNLLVAYKLEELSAQQPILPRSAPSPSYQEYFQRTMSSSTNVAIIGIACRYPGEAKSPQAFYDMLMRGEDAWSEVPLSRFDVNAFHHPSKGRQGNTVRPWKIAIGS